MKTLLISILAGLLFTATTKALTLTTLLSFNGTNGANPYASLTLAPDGNFYGTTDNGGTNGGYGTLFRITTNGELSSMVSFDFTNGSHPSGAIFGPDGNLYGTTASGGYFNDGTVFQVTTGGVWTPFATFDLPYSGALPQAGLTLGPDNNFYGTTALGGDLTLAANAGEGAGTIFQLTTYGSINQLAWFEDTNGEQISAGLTLGPDGNFYGMALHGGQYEYGTIFRVSLSGTLTNLISLYSTNGENPQGNLAVGPDGELYGTTAAGGISGGPSLGTVFKVSTNGVFASLASFVGTNGDSPIGLTLGPDGNFYGTTYYGGTNGYGTIFKMTTNGSLTTLVNFNNTNGGLPHAAITFGNDGNLYGTTMIGGTHGKGTVFVLNLSSPVVTPILLNFYPAGETMVLTWINPAFALQSAPSVMGPYTNIPGATSSYTNNFTATRQFYRLYYSP